MTIVIFGVKRMICFEATLQKFKEKGEKTGWTYIDIPAEIADQLKPGHKKSFRIKGTIDNYPIQGLSLLPMGEGNFILAINASIRKSIKKFHVGERVFLRFEEDHALIKVSEDLLLCLEDEKKAKNFFLKLPGSHQKYYSKWIESAKTDTTRAKRIAMAIDGFKKGLKYNEMMQLNKEKRS